MRPGCLSLLQTDPESGVGEWGRMEYGVVDSEGLLLHMFRFNPHIHQTQANCDRYISFLHRITHSN